MGRTAIADERLWSYLERFNHSQGFVIGLIIGQSSATTDYVVYLARTPSPPSGDEEKIAEASAVFLTSSVKDVNESWITEHALQVTKMLPGGMWVLGLFLIGPSDPFASQSDCSRFRSILRHTRSQLQLNKYLNGDSPVSEKLLLHVNPQSKMVSCRAVDLDGGGSFLQATWKFRKDHWHHIKCTLDLTQVVHISQGGSASLGGSFQVLLDSIQESVSKCMCLIGGELRDGDDLLENIDKKQKGKTDSQKRTKSSQLNENEPKLLNASLFLPMLETNDESRKKSEVLLFDCFESMNIVGGIASHVFLHQKASIEDAVKAIKQDLVRSLGTRLEMHLDSLVEEEEQGYSAGNPVLHEPPRRVLIPLPFTSVTLSDYLFPGEGAEEALASSQDLLDLTVDERLVQKDVEVQAETEALDWKAQHESAGVEKGAATTAEGSSRLILLACVVSLAIVIVAIMMQKLGFLNNTQSKKIS